MFVVFFTIIFLILILRYYNRLFRGETCYIHNFFSSIFYDCFSKGTVILILLSTLKIILLYSILPSFSPDSLIKLIIKVISFPFFNYIDNKERAKMWCFKILGIYFLKEIDIITLASLSSNVNSDALFGTSFSGVKDISNYQETSVFSFA